MNLFKQVLVSVCCSAWLLQLRMLDFNLPLFFSRFATGTSCPPIIWKLRRNFSKLTCVVVWEIGCFLDCLAQRTHEPTNQPTNEPKLTGAKLGRPWPQVGPNTRKLRPNLNLFRTRATRLQVKPTFGPCGPQPEPDATLACLCLVAES